MNREQILVVDDEPETVALVEFNLTRAGYAVLKAADGEEALHKARAAHPALIVLDLTLPEIDGLELCKILRRDPVTAGIPMIMLTARAGEVDRILGLELGADDYVTKPFSPRELVLRIRKLLERGQPKKEAERFVFGELTIDAPQHQVRWGGEEISLTAREFELLLTLVQRRGRVQSREQLLRDVWDYNESVDTRTVDTHMGRLRDKLGPAAKYLETVRGVGYRFVEG